MNLSYRNNNAKLSQLFHMSVTCWREKERRRLFERDTAWYTQQETIQRHHISQDQICKLIDIYIFQDQNLLINANICISEPFSH